MVKIFVDSGSSIRQEEKEMLGVEILYKVNAISTGLESLEVLFYVVAQGVNSTQACDDHSTSFHFLQLIIIRCKRKCSY